jgi:hypothetical protein
MKRAKELGADEYRVKPSGMKDLVELLRELQASWLDGS